jgi:hypothetical protein
MIHEESDNNSEPTSEELTAVPQTVGSFLMSIAFWSALMASAVMYAAVALSPKLADWISVREQHAANAIRLQELEDEADYLERVSAALKSDPEFAHRLVHATQSGSTENEFVPVSGSLVFGGVRDKTSAEQPLVQPAVAELVMHMASHQKHRTWLLSGAAGLTVLAFTLLNESGAGIMQAVYGSALSFFRAAVARYRRDPPVEVTEDSAEVA